MTLQAWRADWPNVSFDPPVSARPLLIPGRRVKVITKPGWLGWEWVSGIEHVLETERSDP